MKSRNDLPNEIDKIEQELIKDKSWKYMGEARTGTRPINSLIQEDVDFATNANNLALSKDESNSIFKYMCLRYKEKTFNNYEFKIKEPEVVEEEYNLELIESNKEIFELYDKIEFEIKKNLDYGN